MINKRNNLVSREELTDTEFDESELRKVDVGITRLRQKIETVPKKPQFIKTIRSKGYMLVCREYDFKKIYSSIFIRKINHHNFCSNYCTSTYYINYLLSNFLDIISKRLTQSVVPI